jgi:hypothetical protein
VHEEALNPFTSLPPQATDTRAPPVRTGWVGGATACATATWGSGAAWRCTACWASRSWRSPTGALTMARAAPAPTSTRGG